jgi:hypothetical protein
MTIRPIETCHMSQFFRGLLMPLWTTCVAFSFYGDLLLYTVLITA